jgi:hypothetical protein
LETICASRLAALFSNQGPDRKGASMTTQPFDPVAFKAAQRADWQVAAPGWRKWYDMLEAAAKSSLAHSSSEPRSAQATVFSTSPLATASQR